MRNTFIIIKREYLERVRTRSFILSTILLPAFMITMMVLPSKLATLKSVGLHRVAVVCANPDFAHTVKSQLEAPRNPADKLNASAKYTVEVFTDLSDTTRNQLRARVDGAQLDGYLWLDDAALETRKINYMARETSDFIEIATLQSALRTALLRQELVQHGVSGDAADRLARAVDLQAVTIKGGKEKRATGPLQFLSVLVLVMLLYMSLLLYGVAVLRSVLEEKNSRVVEVVLSSATAQQLMAGKVLGVGAVGITQIGIWALLAGLASVPGVFAARGMISQLNLPVASIPAFAVFFLLGYILYSALFAALGAMVNSEQEAQQWQFFIMLPIIIPILMMMFVVRQPNAPLSVWMSMVPFFAPILMYIRISVQTPPWWQIAVCIALIVATVWGVMALCSRIYRVGILMYGKRPTLPEIVKWVRYA